MAATIMKTPVRSCRYSEASAKRSRDWRFPALLCILVIGTSLAYIGQQAGNSANHQHYNPTDQAQSKPNSQQSYQKSPGQVTVTNQTNEKEQQKTVKQLNFDPSSILKEAAPAALEYYPETDGYIFPTLSLSSLAKLNYFIVKNDNYTTPTHQSSQLFSLFKQIFTGRPAAYYPSFQILKEADQVAWRVQSSSLYLTAVTKHVVSAMRITIFQSSSPHNLKLQVYGLTPKNTFQKLTLYQPTKHQYHFKERGYYSAIVVRLWSDRPAMILDQLSLFSDV